jgi:hypothetical protein
VILGDLETKAKRSKTMSSKDKALDKLEAWAEIDKLSKVLKFIKEISNLLFIFS